MQTIFFISILHDYKKYKFKVEKIEATSVSESYKVSGKNKSLIFTNNLPVLKAKRLKKWRPKWGMEGELWNVHFQQLIIEALEKEIAGK